MNDSDIRNVQCRSNNDILSKEIFPVLLYHPRVGDLVESKNGKRAKIHSITHLYPHSDFYNKLILEIELTPLNI